MRQHRSEVAGQPVVINVVEHEDDLEGFRDFIRGNLNFLGLDSETTGLDIYSDGFRCRMVQFGTPTEAWTIPVEKGPRFQEDVRLALKGVGGFVLHNASFDLQVFEQTLGVPMEDLWPKVTDTKILAHLVDPRARMEGGSGHSLEELVSRYVDPEVAENVKGLMSKLAREQKSTKNKIWSIIDIDHPEFELYSGMDPILAARLMQRLLPMVPTVSEKLVAYEHKLASICAYMERTGFLLDTDYTLQLSARLAGEEDAWMQIAKDLGCENVNSTDQVADVLEARGVKIKGRTATGKRQVDKNLLADLVKQGDEFAKAVVEGKKAGKWRKTWVQKFLEQADSNSRCHAHINPLQARTARMSITGIPAQTLPSGDWMIRRCFLADEGHLISSVDYQAQELRVLAALSGDKTMIQAFKDGADLHLMTARAAFGEHITKDDPERKYAKVVNFGRVYGGGAKTVAEQTGLDLKRAKIVVDGFDKAYPMVAKLSQKLQREAGQNGHITTPTGRRLPVDPSRAYSALNYLIQSSSRDVTGRALVRLHDAGFTPYLRLPIHDEILASVPAEQAEWGAAEIGRLMAEEMGPVWIGTDPEVGGRSWGSLYGADL
ncbi:DNA polymerase I [Mycobacterium phage MyraDee]|uniref:DNA polymerase n=1 Tax=Mycobacterium phage MyraDee TaxID=2024303 RepID=A0A222YXX9_9CAUD|nr:DNA polymerase I [Mycobacterium phage MyraDee]ASR77148.1 DNA polymerase I [Mycobacterium phage MyraDee]